MIWQMYRPAPVFAVKLTRENIDELRQIGTPYIDGLIVSGKYGSIFCCRYGDYIVKDSNDNHTVASAEAFENSFAGV